MTVGAGRIRDSSAVKKQRKLKENGRCVSDIGATW